MGAWAKGEEGPPCYCGNPTAVIFDEKGRASLLCFAHTRESGAMFALPVARPDKWPNLTNEEMIALVDQGIKEHGTNDESD